MRSLKESLFDTDLVDKNLTFSTRYELTELRTSMGSFYNFYADNDTERELEKNTFKSNKLKNKPMAKTDPSMWKEFNGFIEDMDFWGDFLRLVKMLEDVSWIPEYNHHGAILGNCIPADIEKELKKYLTGSTSVELYIYTDHDACFAIKKNFGGREKWISFRAIFREK
jgi:hypothetical protein